MEKVLVNPLPALGIFFFSDILEQTLNPIMCKSKKHLSLVLQYIDTQKTLADFNDNERQEIEDFEALKSKTGWRLKQAKIWMILDYPGSSKLALVRTLNCPGSSKLALVRTVDSPGSSKLALVRTLDYPGSSKLALVRIYRSLVKPSIAQA